MAPQRRKITGLIMLNITLASAMTILEPNVTPFVGRYGKKLAAQKGLILTEILPLKLDALSMTMLHITTTELRLKHKFNLQR